MFGTAISTLVLMETKNIVESLDSTLEFPYKVSIKKYAPCFIDRCVYYFRLLFQGGKNNLSENIRRLSLIEEYYFTSIYTRR